MVVAVRAMQEVHRKAGDVMTCVMQRSEGMVGGKGPVVPMLHGVLLCGHRHGDAIMALWGNTRGQWGMQQWCVRRREGMCMVDNAC